MKNNLQIALEKVIEKETSAYEQGGEHTFSPDFEKEMNALVKKSGRGHSKKSRIGMIILAAAMTVLTLGAGAMAQSTGFIVSSAKNDDIFRVPMRYFTYEDKGDSSKTIETFYTISGLSDKYTYKSTVCVEENLSYTTLYLTSDSLSGIYDYNLISLSQSVKSEFEERFIDAKYSHFEEFVYNERPAYYAYYERYYGREAMLVWEDGEYCFSLKGNLTKEKAMEMADSLVPAEMKTGLNEIEEEKP